MPPPETVVFDIDERVEHGVSMSIENCSLSGRTLGRHHVEPPRRAVGGSPASGAPMPNVLTYTSGNTVGLI